MKNSKFSRVRRRSGLTERQDHFVLVVLVDDQRPEVQHAGDQVEVGQVVFLGLHRRHLLFLGHPVYRKREVAVQKPEDFVEEFELQIEVFVDRGTQQEQEEIVVEIATFSSR